MAQRVVIHKDWSGAERRERPREDAVVATCPICSGKMEAVYRRHNTNVCVCTDCHSGVTVPGNAWEIVRAKRRQERHSR
jgi:hypothetical protein